MKVFISWSGDKSRQTAIVLKEWLPVAMDGVKPFVSDADISAGVSWQTALESALEQGGFGVVCLTRDNLNSPWVNFEVGWLSALGRRVAVILLDLEVQEVSGPLSRLQLTPLRSSDVEALLKSINDVNPHPMDLPILKQRFNLVWPVFEERMGTQSMKWVEYNKAVEDLVNMIWHPPDRNDFEPDILICVNHGGAILGGLIYYKKGRVGNPLILTSITRFSKLKGIELNHILPITLGGRFHFTEKQMKELRILLVDDSIKSGKSLKSAVDMVQAIAVQHCQKVDVRTAVIVNYKSEFTKAIEPDYYLKDRISCVMFPYGPI